MRIEIQDPDALRSVPSANLIAHLSANGWIETGVWRERAWIYGKEVDGRPWEILVPMRDTGSGYARNMFETVSVLSDVENRSQMEVFHALAAAGSDTIRFAPIRPKPHDVVSLHRSRHLSTAAYDLLASAARSVEAPAAAFRGRPPAQVSEYLDAVAPVPGYYDDFDLLIHSPVPPQLQLQSDVEPTPPFARRVTRRLSIALSTTELAIGKAIKSGGLQAFDDVVDDGVSANLCSALADLAGLGGIQIGVSWAAVHPGPDTGATYRFRQDAASVLNDARTYLNSRAPRLGENIVGDVVLLTRGPNDKDGIAHIEPDRSDLPSPLAATFDPPEYDKIIQAFRAQTKVMLTADIHTKGRMHELRNPRNIRRLSGSA